MEWMFDVKGLHGTIDVISNPRTIIFKSGGFVERKKMLFRLFFTLRKIVFKGTLCTFLKFKT